MNALFSSVLRTAQKDKLTQMISRIEVLYLYVCSHVKTHFSSLSYFLSVSLSLSLLLFPPFFLVHPYFLLRFSRHFNLFFCFIARFFSSFRQVRKERFSVCIKPSERYASFEHLQVSEILHVCYVSWRVSEWGKRRGGGTERGRKGEKTEVERGGIGRTDIKVYEWEARGG